ncbi:MAG: cell division protein FtsB [Gammaproteobacteria bacterium]|nr:cell division protein FtsB [Gammaproteobacteria bacterium]
MRLLLLALCLSLLLLQGRLWVSGEGIREVNQLKAQVAERTEENRMLAVRNAALEAEVQDLKQGLAAVEERARVDLGMIATGETFFQITPQRLTDSDR